MIHVIIPAAGLGTRFGGQKQFLKLKGRPLLDWAFESFQGLDGDIIVCVPPEAPIKDFKNVRFILGGSSRAESVNLGFQALDPSDADFVLIHDAARPLVSLDLIDRVVTALKDHPAVIPVIPVRDTLKEVCDSKVIRSIDREKIAAAQTPQGFSCALLRRMYKQLALDPHFTDEAMMLEAIGEEVFCVEGEESNLKITTPSDLNFAEWILNK